jgi:hypothetical protein
MTTSTTASYITYAGDDSTTTFAIPFDFLNSTEIDVTLVTDSTNNAVLQTITTHYSVSGTDVEMVTAPATGETLIIELDVAESQATDYVTNDPFPAETHEAALDKLTRFCKQLRSDIDNKCFKFPTNILTSTTITDTDISALNVLRIDSGGTAIELASIDEITNGGDSWGDPVDASIAPDTDSTYNIGASGNEFLNVYADNLYGTLQTAAQANITSVGTLTSLDVDNININGNTISASSGDVVIGSSDNIDLSNNTTYVLLPSGTTAQRTGSTAGEFRFNTTDSKVEYYTGSAWQQLVSAGGPGAWSDPIDTDITVDTDSTHDIGTTGARLQNLYADNLYGVVAEAAQTSITSLGTLTTLTVDNITVNGNDISSGSGDITFTPTGVVDMTASTDHFLPPTGTTAQRSGTTAGQTRYNSTDNKLEYYNGSSWIQLDAASAGAMIFIDSQTASSSSELDFTTSIDSTYDTYVFILEGIVPATDGVVLDILVSTDGGSTFKSGASDYDWMGDTYTTAGSIDSADTRIPATYTFSTYTVGNDAGNSINGNITLSTPSNSSLWTWLHGQTSYRGSTVAAITYSFSGRYTSTTAVDAIRFKFSSGNITSGTIRLYGISKS